MKDSIIVETKKGFVKVDWEEIVSIRALERKTELLLESGRRLESVWLMKQWKEMLAELPFFESHRGVIVNLGHVLEVEGDRLVLRGGEEEYLSRRRYPEFKKVYLEFVGGEPDEVK